MPWMHSNIPTSPHLRCRPNRTSFRSSKNPTSWIAGCTAVNREHCRPLLLGGRSAWVLRANGRKVEDRPTATDPLTFCRREDIDMDLPLEATTTPTIPETADLHRQLPQENSRDGRPGKPTTRAAWRFLHALLLPLQGGTPDRLTLRPMRHGRATVQREQDHRRVLAIPTSPIITTEPSDLEAWTAMALAAREADTTITQVTREEGDEVAAPCDMIKSTASAATIPVGTGTGDEVLAFCERSKDWTRKLDGA